MAGIEAQLNSTKERNVEVSNWQGRNNAESYLGCLWISISGFESLGGSQQNQLLTFPDFP